MWAEVVFEGATPSRGMEMVWALLDAGLVMNKDFTWCYIPKNSVGIVYHDEDFVPADKSVIIGFQDPALATFYSLKWQR
jgi:hypothetical protein